MERTLVNVAHVESLCLARDRNEAERLYDRYPISNRVLTIDLLSVQRYSCVNYVSKGLVPDPFVAKEVA